MFGPSKRPPSFMFHLRRANIWLALGFHVSNKPPTFDASVKLTAHWAGWGLAVAAEQTSLWKYKPVIHSWVLYNNWEGFTFQYNHDARYISASHTYWCWHSKQQTLNTIRWKQMLLKLYFWLNFLWAAAAPPAATVQWDSWRALENEFSSHSAFVGRLLTAQWVQGSVSADIRGLHHMEAIKTAP